MAPELSSRMRKAHEAFRKLDKNPITDKEVPAEDLSLRQIFETEQDQEQFFDLLRQKQRAEAPAIVDALVRNVPLEKLRPHTIELLEEVRKEYNHRKTELREIRAELDAAEMAEIGKMDKRLATVVGQVGPQKAGELFARELERLAFSDSTKYQEIVAQLREKNKREFGRDAVALDKRVAERLRGLGISEEKYFEATKGGPSAETERKIFDLVSERLTGWRRVLRWIPLSTVRRDKAKLYNDYLEQERLLAELDDRRADVAKLLQSTITPEHQIAIQKHIVEGSEIMPYQERVGTIDELKSHMEKVEATRKKDAMQKRFNEFFTAAAKKLKEKDPAKQQPDNNDIAKIKDDFAKAELKRLKEYKDVDYKKTTFSALFGAVFDLLFKIPGNKKTMLKEVNALKTPQEQQAPQQQQQQTQQQLRQQILDQLRRQGISPGSALGQAMLNAVQPTGQKKKKRR